MARRVMTVLQDGSEAIVNRMRANTGVIRVAATPAAIGGLLVGTLGKFARAHPDIQVHVVESSASGEIDGALLEEAEIACTREPSVIPEGWQFLRCSADQLVVVCGEQHPLAAQQSATTEELGQYRWLMNRVGSVARRRFEETYHACNWSEDVRGSLVIHVPELTREILATQDVLAILPQSAAQPWIASGRVRALETSMTAELRPLGLLHPVKGEGLATRRFTNFFKNRFAG